MNRAGPAVVLAVLGALGCRPEDQPPVASEVLREGVDMALVDMRTFVTREGVRRALLEADTAEFVGETEIHMRPVTLTFYDHEGREMSVITADSGIYYELSEDMQAEGSIVVLDRQDDQRLETERLRYANSEDRLYGDVPFTLWSDGDRTVIRGASFVSDPGLDSVTVNSPSGRAEQRLLGGAARDTAVSPTDPAGGGAAGEDTAPAGDPAPDDTTGAPGDTTAAADDTTAAPLDTTSAPAPDTTASPGEPAPASGDTATVRGARG